MKHINIKGITLFGAITIFAITMNIMFASSDDTIPSSQPQASYVMECLDLEFSEVKDFEYPELCEALLKYSYQDTLSSADKRDIKNIGEVFDILETVRN